MKAVCRFLILGQILLATAGATTFYVATSGDDAAAGSLDAPVRTIMRGVQMAGPGDTVIVRDGTYGHEGSTNDGDGMYAGQASPVTLSNSGTPDAWIVIQAEHKWGAILDCEMLCDAYINLANASYVVIRDFVLTRGYKEGIHSNDAAHHIALYGNRIEYIANRYSSSPWGLSGLYTNPRCHDFVISGNVFHDIGRTNASQLDHALYLRGSNFTVVNNIFYRTTRGWAIQLADGLSNTVIANNTFGFPNTADRDGQIMLWNTQSNLVIRNNIFYFPANYAITRYRSTLYGCTMDHNLVVGAQGLIRDSAGCVVEELGLTDTSPMFVNPTYPPYDFHLLPESPAIGAGVPVAVVPDDHDGRSRPPLSAPSIGAYEGVRGPRQPQ